MAVVHVLFVAALLPFLAAIHFNSLILFSDIVLKLIADYSRLMQ